MNMKNVKYASTISKPANMWDSSGVGPEFELLPPAPVMPKEDGNWVLLGPGAHATRNGYTYIVWTWADVGSMAEAAAAFGAGVGSVSDVFGGGAGEPAFDADLVVPGASQLPPDPNKPDLPVAQEGDHRCGVHSTGGYQCEFAAHDGIIHYNTACGTFVTQLAASEETPPVL